MRALFTLLLALATLAALHGVPVVANEILEVLDPPQLPADDAPSPSDLLPPDATGPKATPSNFDCGCYHDCESTWSGYLGALYLHRNRPAALPLVSDDFIGGATLIDASQFDPGTAWGVELALLRRRVFGTDWGVEGKYFGIDSWNAAVGPIDSPNGATVQYFNPVGNTFFPATVSASFESTLRSFELNGRRDFSEWLDLLAGVRYVELIEGGLTVNQDVGPGLNTVVYQTNSSNHLWGFQLGADGRMVDLPRFKLNTFAKAGVYSNSMNSNTEITQTTGPLYSAFGSRSGAAFLGELGLVGLYQLTDRWSLRASYQTLWLSSVALATEQVPVTDPAFGTADVDRSGDLFYHGGFIGLQRDW